MDANKSSSAGSSSGSGHSGSSYFNESIGHEESISSTSTSLISKPQEDHRTVVRDELGPIPEVTVEFLLEHIIPNSNVDVKATVTKLKEAKLLSDSEDSRWNVLEKDGHPRSPKTTLATENDLNHSDQGFSRMKDIYNSIISYAQFHDRCIREPTLTFQSIAHSASVLDDASEAGPSHYGGVTTNQEIHTKHLNMSPLCEIRSSVARKVTWFDTACVWRYKATNRTEDLNENVLDMVWSLDHIMQIDHRRRFIFGITVENKDMRIWLTCREVLLVTRPFNLNTHTSQLVQLIASLAYATPTQLGYDPTMRLRWRDNTFHYDIECSTKRSNGSERKVLYQTQKVLSDTASELRGRATRVYLALARDQDEASTSNRLVVLKDSWIDANCPREGDTHSKLLQGASEEEKRLFLTVYQHGIVQIDKEDDSTRDLILKGKKIKVTDSRSRGEGQNFDFLCPDHVEEKKAIQVSDICIFNLYTPTANDSGPSVWKTKFEWFCPPGETERYVPLVWEPEVYSPKVHYRIVFEDVGESLKRIARSGKATVIILEQVMCDITKALHYMAKRGYVHRDVSYGNILWFGDHAKLSDLEFAREYGTGGSSDTRTGTYKFMSGEVMAGEYSLEKRDLEDPQVPFIYNPVHDLESLWWVGAWSIMYYFPPPHEKIIHPLEDGEDLAAKPRIEYKFRDFISKDMTNHDLTRYLANQLFPPSQNYSADFRMEEIHNKRRFTNRLNNDCPLFFQALTYCLDNMRECISLAYREIHKDLPRTDVSYFTDALRITAPRDLWYHDPTMEGTSILVHDRILQVLQLASKLAEPEDVKLWPIHAFENYSPQRVAHREEGTCPCPIEDCFLCENMGF